MRVSEFAKEIGKSSKEVLEVLQKHNFDVKSHASNVNDEQMSVVKKTFSNKTESAPAKSESSGDMESPKKKITAVYRPQRIPSRTEAQDQFPSRAAGTQEIRVRETGMEEIRIRVRETATEEDRARAATREAVMDETRVRETVTEEDRIRVVTREAVMEMEEDRTREAIRAIAMEETREAVMDETKVRETVTEEDRTRAVIREAVMEEIRVRAAIRAAVTEETREAVMDEIKVKETGTEEVRAAAVVREMGGKILRYADSGKAHNNRMNKNAYKNDKYEKKNMTEDGPRTKGKVSKTPLHHASEADRRKDRRDHQSDYHSGTSDHQRAGRKDETHHRLS